MARRVVTRWTGGKAGAGDGVVECAAVEGTDIQETVETGRQYIEVTRKYVDIFKGLLATGH